MPPVLPMEGRDLPRYVPRSVAESVSPLHPRIDGHIRRVWRTIGDEGAWAEREEAARGSD